MLCIHQLWVEYITYISVLRSFIIIINNNILDLLSRLARFKHFTRNFWFPWCMIYGISSCQATNAIDQATKPCIPQRIVRSLAKLVWISWYFIFTLMRKNNLIYEFFLITVCCLQDVGDIVKARWKNLRYYDAVVLSLTSG